MKTECHSKENISAATKICYYGRCIETCFDCGHKKSTFPVNTPKIGKLETCPLQEYNLEDKTETRNWWEIPAVEKITLDDIWNLCKECPHSEVFEEDGEVVIRRTNLRELCIDCPVFSIGDSIFEMEAEVDC